MIASAVVIEGESRRGAMRARETGAGVALVTTITDGITIGGIPANVIVSVTRDTDTTLVTIAEDIGTTELSKIICSSYNTQLLGPRDNLRPELGFHALANILFFR